MSISPNIWWKQPANNDKGYIWVNIGPDVNGDVSNVFVVNLIQVLLGILGESPMFADYGIPAERSVVTQIFPDFYVNQTQQQFTQYFASLQITKQNQPSPTYSINLITNTGATFNASIRS
jgi:hypothetical protein